MTPLWGPLHLPEGGVRFRLWAPACETLALRWRGEDRPMKAADDGWFSLDVPEASAGDRYAFVLPDGLAVPDPASRCQAGDVHGASVVVPDAAPASWAGRPWAEASIYELHVGTLTEAGTFRAAIDVLDRIAEAGFTCVEIMPVAQFAGDRGWGYDGVLPYAVQPDYGTPDDLRALVAAAQSRGLMVLLDVVYNHFGPEGNYLGAYAPAFFDPARDTPWGQAIDYANPNVRAFFVENAVHWIDAFGLDGLRLDAIDHIRDASDEELLLELARVVRGAERGRPIHLTTEDNRNVTHLHLRTGRAATRYTAEWNDDVHNAAHVALTGETEGYYADYADAWGLLARGLARGYAYGGQVSPSTGRARGEDPGVLPPLAFIDFLQNHDQIGNRARGERLTEIADSDRLKAMLQVLLLSPHVPMAFMGDEWGTRRRFRFFAGFEGDLARAVSEGRRREFADFSAFSPDRGEDDPFPDPIDRATFEGSRLDWAERETPEGRAHLDFVRRLLELRLERIAPHLGGAPSGGGEVVASGDGLLAVDWTLDGGTLRLRARFGEGDLPEAAGEPIARLEAGDARVLHTWEAL